jgi:CO/xanthine dehydrogenase Mo-binding subunit
VSRGRGIAFAKYKNLAVYVAVIADIEVAQASGVIRVPGLSLVADAGLIINPNGMMNQLEGGAIQSTSWTLREAIDFDNSRISTRSWADYPVLRFADVPAVSVSLINRPNEKSLGVGEGAQGPAAAAIANAFAAATGKRLRDIPFNPAKVKALLGV